MAKETLVYAGTGRNKKTGQRVDLYHDPIDGNYYYWLTSFGGFIVTFLKLYEDLDLKLPNNE